jgi:hypothetical protein
MNNNWCGRRSNCYEENNENEISIFGEFINTFSFGSLQLPIVQPGAPLIFPIQTVQSSGVIFVQNINGTGLVVPRGTYLVTITLNPSVGATVDLLVNGNKPLTSTAYPYAESVVVGPVSSSFLVSAPLRRDNLISLVNGGTSLFTLGNIPNTTIGNVSIITQIRVQRL